MTPAQKLSLVTAVLTHVARGQSVNQACALAGVSRSNFQRWSSQLEASGGDIWLAFEPKKPTGRPVLADLTESEIAIARWHRMTKGSLPVAVHFFAHDERVRPEIRMAVKEIEARAAARGCRATYPPSIRRAFHVTAEIAAEFRGKKHRMNQEMVSPRGMFYINEQGDSVNILPGQLWEMDDYSCNQPFAYPDIESGELRTGRQVLACMDVASAAWLSFDAIGRPRDAYRGEDILRFIERSFRAHGMPLFLRLERGSWDSSAVHGIDVDGVIEGWGGLDEIVNIQHVFKSKGKGTIESSFSHLQTWLSHSSLDIGRYAGEFEMQSKAMRQAQNSTTLDDVRKLGIWEQSQAIAAHESAAALINSRPRSRDVLGAGTYAAPDDLRAQKGWHTIPFPEAHAWRFLTHKECRTVTGGTITIKPGGGYEMMEFVVNGTENLHLDHGHRVLVACDPARPELGAYICNADSSARNRHGWAIGQHLCTAPLMSQSPQFNLSGKRHSSMDLRRRASAAATTEFRAIRSAAPGSNLRVTVASDGMGQRAEITNASPHRSSAAVSAADERSTLSTGTERTTRHRRDVVPASEPVPAHDRLAQLRAAETAALEHL